jgi:predicted ATPase/DNA-binding CsgD family transcriptional regulator
MAWASSRDSGGDSRLGGDNRGVPARVSARELIGRAAELAELEAAFAEAAAGAARLAFIAGESGVGKSRLLNELLERAAEAGGRCFGGECIELGADELPYAPLTGALRALARDGDPVLEDLSESDRAALARLAPELAPSSAAADGSAAADRGAAGDEWQRQPLEALLVLVERLAEDSPLVLWIDDAQWADRGTRHVLTYLARSLREDCRLLTVIAYRSEEISRRHPLRPLLAELGRGERVRRLELAPFGREELATQLRDILGEEPAPAVVERLFQRTEGNPLFTEELLAAGPDGRGGLPSTLRDALLLRVERLPPAGLSALQVLAAATRADHRLLAAASPLDEAALSEGLREAVSSQVIVVGSDDRYGFRHALLREVIYEDLLPGERAEIHHCLARHLEARLPTSEDPALLAAAVAHHYHAAEDQPEALRSAVAAARAAEGVQAPGASAALLDRALGLWKRVPEAEDLAGMDHAELLELAARSHGLDADEAHAITLYERALGELDEAAEPVRVARILIGVAAARWGLGQADAARADLDRALELLPASDPTPERASILEGKARFLLLQGRYEEARDAGEEALRAAEAAGVEGTKSGVLSRLGLARFFYGEFERGLEEMRESVELARRAGSNDEIATAFLNYADALHLGGRTEEGLELAALAAREVAPGDRSEVGLDCLRSELLFELGRWDEAEAALPKRSRVASGTTRFYLLLRHATLAVGRGELKAARQQVEELQRSVVDAVEPQYFIPAGALVAELELREGDVEAARAAIDQAIDRIEYCSDEPIRMAQIAAAGAAVEGDAAAAACDVDDEPARELALSRAELMSERARASEPESPAAPYLALARAYRRSAEAGLARAAGEEAAARALEAAAAWEELRRPYPAAVHRWRAAEALVADGERRAAAEAATQTRASAERIGSAWLVSEVEGLIARARLPVGAGAAPSDGSDGNGAGAGGEEDPFGLTPRERQVLAALARGATNREIAAELFIAEKTASVHVSRILGKLDVRSRTEAAAVAHRHGLEASGD